MAKQGNTQVNRFALAVVAVALGSIVTGTVALLAPGASAPGFAAAPAETVGEPFVYFPAQYVNQATEIEPAPPTF